MSPTPDEERSLRMQAIRNAISEGRYAVDPAGVAQAVLARLAVPESRDAALIADAGGSTLPDAAWSTCTPDRSRARSHGGSLPSGNP